MLPYQVQFFGDEYVLYRQRTWIGIPFLSWRAVLLGIAESRDHLDPLKPQIRRSHRPACVAQFDCSCWVGACTAPVAPLKLAALAVVPLRPAILWHGRGKLTHAGAFAKATVPEFYDVVHDAHAGCAVRRMPALSVPC